MLDAFTTANASLVVAHNNAMTAIQQQFSSCQQQHVKDLQALAAAQSQVATLNGTVATLNGTVSALQKLLAAASAPTPTTQPTPGQSAWMGANANFVADYGEPVLPDCLLQCASGGSKPYPNNQTPWTTDANGNPTEPGTTSAGISMGHRPAGDYVVAVKGNCKIELRGMVTDWKGPGTLGGIAYDNIGTVHYVPPAGGANVLFDFNTADSSKPFSYLEGHLWHPTYEPGGANAGKMFLNEFITPLRNFSCLRVLQAMKMITRDDREWGDRAKLTDRTWTNGLPLEAAIQMAIDAGVKWAWFNAPLNSTSDYRKQQAAMIDALWAKPWIWESFDEYWNKFGEISRGYSKAFALATDPTTGQQFDGNIVGGVWQQSPPGTSVTNSEERTWRACGYLQYMAMLDSAGHSNCHPVLSGQAGDSRVLDWAAAYLTARFGTTPFTDFAIAPYHEPLIGPKYSDAASFLAADAKFIAETLPGQLAAFVATCKTYGKGRRFYECGISPDDFYFVGDPATIRAAIFAAPAFAANEAMYWPKLRAVADVANVFVYYGAGTAWDIMPDPANPRWVAVVGAK